MSDGRKTNGGNKNAGRKSKADEQQLIERLTPLMPSAFKALKKALKEEHSWAVKLSFEYCYGKPRQQLAITTKGDKINNSPKITFK